MLGATSATTGRGGEGDVCGAPLHAYQCEELGSAGLCCVGPVGRRRQQELQDTALLLAEECTNGNVKLRDFAACFQATYNDVVRIFGIFN
jgi:hypothetical protein